ncbi:FkbM family methyltransferase [Tranquillimonas alkanivorans]|uniref:Methyltransferase, FkbM family n=1 Tax=Tranquillimonas alkanivorans TaxID=441119 RepID=A0A1I5R676_9RHOB|nr:FkbM family methyltransferase [Tranquillimonas alkanivorans]SFP54019.1 methyltransferase, FkbM family [Tranquillimonas alkanivorans]
MSERDDSLAERRAKKLIRRQERNLRKARAEGFLHGVAAMLRPGDLAIDCGANVGDVTEVLAATGADVIAFEPDPWAVEKLEARFVDRPNVRLIAAALGVEEGNVRLMRSDGFGDNPEGASVKSTVLSGGRAIDAANAVDVPLIDFPAFLESEADRRGRVDFVKMDIEGAELEILEVMERRGLFDRVRCLVAETHARKFKHLRPRFRALRDHVSEKYPPHRVNLDWI